jgi:hypothetical protein
MECRILQQQWKIVKSIMALRFCKSEHLATQHNSSGHHQSSHNPPLYSASYWTVAVTNPARRDEKQWPPSMNGIKDWHQPMSQACCTRHGQRHTNLQSDISKYYPLDQDFASQSVNRKQLSSDIIDPYFYGTNGSAVSRQAEHATVGKVSKFEW